MKKIFFILAALVAATPAFADEQLTVSMENAEKSAAINTLEKGYIVVTMKNGKWVVISINGTRPERLPGQEILKYPELSLAYEENGEWILQPNRYGCKVRSNKGYTPCTSALTSFGAADLFGVAGYNYYYLKKEDFSRLIADILIDPIYKNFDYHSSFSKATSRTDLEHWVEKFKGKYDPDNLVITAEQKITAFKDKEAADAEQQRLKKYRRSYEAATSSALLQSFINEYATNDPENLVPKAKAQLIKVQAIENKEAALRQEQEAERQRKAAAAIAIFRHNIKVETETNCGPVLEAKGNLVKVYSPVQNYGTEHWVRRSQLFPPGSGCRFVNGQYIQPM